MVSGLPRNLTCSNHTGRIPLRRVVLALNNTLPQVFEKVWLKGRLRVCADGGANRVYARLSESGRLTDGLFPDYIVGDLDSAHQNVLAFFEEKGTIVIHDASQDTDDLQKSLSVIEKRLKNDDRTVEVAVVGAMGGSLTHELAAFNALFLRPHWRLVCLSDHNIAMMLQSGKHHFSCIEPTKCGLIPLGNPCRHVHTVGLRWNLHGEELRYGGLISSSNETVSEDFSLDVSDPVLFTVDLRYGEIPSLHKEGLPVLYDD